MTSLRHVVVLLVAGCAGSGPTPAATAAESSTGDERRIACVSDEERAAVSLEGTTAERMERAGLAIETPATGSLGPTEARDAAIHGLVLLESVERESEDPTEARVAALTEIDVLQTLGTDRPSCGDEICGRLDGMLARHCAEELPADDVTAICPTLRRYRERCPEGT